VSAGQAAVRIRLALLPLALFLSVQSAAAAELAQVEIPVSERTVTTMLAKAPGVAPRPAVLMLHGGGGFDPRLDDYEEFAFTLAAEGFDTYLVYYYSNADETARQAGRSVAMQRFPDWAVLTGEVAAYAAAQPDSSGKVGLVGFSNGGILAVGTGAAHPDIAAAVVYYGAIPFWLAHIGRLPPMLVLHGDADTTIPISAGSALYDLGQRLGARTEIKVYPGAGHGFGARGDDTPESSDSLARTIAFLKRELQAQ